jgi:hypothetical protein
MTPALLGNLSVALALAFSLLGLALALLAYLQGDGRFLKGAKALAPLTLLSALAAFMALEWALLTHDFSLAYVARNHSLQDPLWVTLVTPWAALEGSILLWGLLQTLYTFVASRKPLGQKGAILTPGGPPWSWPSSSASRSSSSGSWPLLPAPSKPSPTPPPTARAPTPSCRTTG